MSKKWISRISWILSVVFLIAFIVETAKHHNYKKNIVKAGTSDFCKSIGRFAFSAEKVRQLGLPEDMVIDSLNANSEIASSEFHKVITLSIIKQAYLYPLYAGETKQEEAAIDFSNAMYLICVRGMAK